MQNRMDAGFRKYCPCDTTLINYATYKVHFTVQNDKLCLEQNSIWQMWNIDKYIELLMGEIPRLQIISMVMALKVKILSPM